MLSPERVHRDNKISLPGAKANHEYNVVRRQLEAPLLRLGSEKRNHPLAAYSYGSDARGNRGARRPASIHREDVAKTQPAELKGHLVEQEAATPFFSRRRATPVTSIRNATGR
jgi:hypothetical protein